MEKIALDSNLLNKKVAAKEIFGSNLLLQNKLVRASAPNSSELAGGNQWDALCASHQKVGLLSETRILERCTGFEPVTFCLGSRRSTAELTPQKLMRSKRSFAFWRNPGKFYVRLGLTKFPVRVPNQGTLTHCANPSTK